MSSHSPHAWDPNAAPRDCQNCGTRLQGPFCHNCGQQDFDFHRSFHHVFLEGLETWFHFDGKFFQGFYDLLFRPGVMSREFNEGKRVRHVPPLRFYLVISLLFFFFITPGKKTPVELNIRNDDPAVQKIVESRIENAARRHGIGLTVSREFAQKFEGKFRNPQELVQTFMHTLPKTLLVCLPIFALLTRLAYRRSGWVLLQHLVFSLHLHSFLFLWWMVARGWSEIIGMVWGMGDSIFSLLAFLYPFVYFVLALRHISGQSIKHSLIRACFVGFAYGMILVAAIVATLMVSILWL